MAGAVMLGSPGPSEAGAPPEGPAMVSTDAEGAGARRLFRAPADVGFSGLPERSRAVEWPKGCGKPVVGSNSGLSARFDISDEVEGVVLLLGRWKRRKEEGGKRCPDVAHRREALRARLWIGRRSPS